MKRKGLAVGIILLFIGVAVAPSINSTVVKASNDNDLVEVTSQTCGIQGFGNTTVKLTKEQYQNLEQYLVDFRARLNQTTTREEAVPIFKDAVLELNRYGLLPKGMSPQRVQDIVTGRSIPKRIHHILERIAQGGSYVNLFALVYVNGEIIGNINLLYFLLFALPGYSGFATFVEWYSATKPLNLFSLGVDLGPGQLFSIGLMGIKHYNFSGEFGLLGFTGLQIITKFDSSNGFPVNGIYLGWSFAVSSVQF
jgi:hypothetical protein